MAGCYLTTNRAHAILAALLIVCAVGWAVPAHATIAGLYHLAVCGGPDAPTPGSPCYVETPQGPLPASVAEIDAAVQVFYSQFPHRQHVNIRINGITNTGIVYGDAQDTEEMIDGQFIFYGGTVYCCATDFPFRIAGINDAGLVIGRYDFPFATYFPNEYSDFTRLPPVNLDADSINYLDLVYPFGWGNFFAETTRFFAVDNAARISGTNGTLGSFILVPVPEPAGSALLLTGLALLFGLWRVVREERTPICKNPAPMRRM